MSQDHATKLNDFLYDSVYSAAVGAAAVAIFFLISDLLQGQPLFTPSLVGSALFLGLDPASVGTVHLGVIGLFSLVHFAAFFALGATTSWAIQREPRLPARSMVLAIALFASLEGGVLIFDALFAPGTLAAVGHGEILVANVLAASSMALSLRHAHGVPFSRPASSPAQALG
jgi:hypothetical protein